MNEAQLAQMYDLKVKAVAEELKKAQGILALQEELKSASQAGADHRQHPEERAGADRRRLGRRGDQLVGLRRQG